MKKIMMIIVMLVGMTGFTQEKGVYVDPVLIPYVQDYIDEAAERNIDVVPQINSMDFIKFNPDMYYPTLGAASVSGNRIYIADFTKSDTLMMKTVVFHELTHTIFKTQHCKCDSNEIMSEVSPESFSIYADKVYWEERLNYLFKNL